MLPILISVAMLAASAQEAPVVTAPAPPRPATTLRLPSAPLPSAPADDYGFVAWCYGSVSQHVDAYEALKPELRAIEQAGFDLKIGSTTPDEAMAAYDQQV